MAALRILLVDSDLDSLKAHSTLLEGWGHEVRTIQSGLVLSAAQELLPDLVFLDLGMPEMDGCEVARLLRREPELEGIVLVAVNGSSTDELRVRAVGFDAHLLKPIGPQILEFLVNVLADPVDRNGVFRRGRLSKRQIS